jgi:hypothetical protein
MSEDPTRGHGFDELARGLAEGSISRRRALKLFAGTAIAALIPARAMAAVTCPAGTVKVCDVPQTASGCDPTEPTTRCLTPAQAADLHAKNPCACCGGCGGTNDCRDPKPPTCFSTSSTTSTSTSTSTTSTSTTKGCIGDGDPCTMGGAPCCSADRECRGGARHPNRLLCRPKN